jgi:hypothetical protein
MHKNKYLRWLGTQSGANPSQWDFPVKQGKNREILQFAADRGADAPHNAQFSLVISDKFPTRDNREFF